MVTQTRFLFACTLSVAPYVTVWERFHSHSKEHRIYPKYRGVFELFGLFIFAASRDISVSIVIKLQATNMRNHGSVLGTNKKFLSSQTRP
jgi:hypothetical protein